MRRAMKNINNAILDRWAGTLGRRGPEAAVLGPDGAVERTFADIEREAGQWVEKLGRWQPGTVVAIEVGNSASWPALVLGAMRLGLIPLPLGRHMARDERDLTLATCGAGALVTGMGEVEERGGEMAPGLEGCDFL